MVTVDIPLAIPRDDVASGGAKFSVVKLEEMGSYFSAMDREGGDVGP